jgi:hypothetical protein
MQTPEPTTRNLRSDAPTTDKQDTPSFPERDMQSATPESFTSTTLDTPRGDLLNDQDIENPEEGLRAILSQDDYKTWAKLILELKSRGPRLPAFRIQRRAVMKDFLGHHPKAIYLHDKYARSHNKRYEGKHERFHLPILEDLEMEKVRVSKGKEAAQVQQLSRKLNVRKPTAAHVLSMQYDGAMDAEMEESLQLADDHEVRTAVGADKRLLSSGRNEEEEDDDDGADIEKENARVGYRTGPIQNASGAVAAAAADNTESVVLEPRLAQGIDARPDNEAEVHPLEAEMVIEMHEEGDGADASNKDEQQPSDVPIMSAEDPQAAAPNFAVPNAATAIDSVGSKPAAAMDLTPAIDSTTHVAQDSSVQSYLAWLLQRQTRFPIAKPNYSECAALAEKLGRSLGCVYDEIMSRWGLETDSKWGDWYKQNRLQVLGQDPRFDDETMGKWEAWLKQGRDLEAGSP